MPKPQKNAKRPGAGTFVGVLVTGVGGLLTFRDRARSKGGVYGGPGTPYGLAGGTRPRPSDPVGGGYRPQGGCLGNGGGRVMRSCWLQTRGAVAGRSASTCKYVGFTPTGQSGSAPAIGAGCRGRFFPPLGSIPGRCWGDRGGKRRSGRAVASKHPGGLVGPSHRAGGGKTRCSVPGARRVRRWEDPPGARTT